MKTFNKIYYFLILLVVACDSYPEKDAKVLIQSRVEECIKVDLVMTNLNGLSYWVAIDSSYNTYSFRVDDEGDVIPLLKNGKPVK